MAIGSGCAVRQLNGDGRPQVSNLEDQGHPLHGRQRPGGAHLGEQGRGAPDDIYLPQPQSAHEGCDHEGEKSKGALGETLMGPPPHAAAQNLQRGLRRRLGRAVGPGQIAPCACQYRDAVTGVNQMTGKLEVLCHARFVGAQEKLVDEEDMHRGVGSAARRWRPRARHRILACGLSRGFAAPLLHR
jgi:hypothetical protein